MGNLIKLIHLLKSVEFVAERIVACVLPRHAFKLCTEYPSQPKVDQ